MSKSTIIQAYTDAIYTHTKKNIVGGWATTSIGASLIKTPGLTADLARWHDQLIAMYARTRVAERR